MIPTQSPDRRFVVIKQPIGVCAAITPWNFPIAMITRKCAPGLAVGCTFVGQTRRADAVLRAGAGGAGRAGRHAKGVFNIITCDSSKAPEVGKVLCASPIVKKVTFTGSTEVGRILMRQSADTVKKMGWSSAATPASSCSMMPISTPQSRARWPQSTATPGQTCVCANRIYVQDKVYDAFAAKLTEKVKQMKVGQGFEDGVVQGPLIDGQALKRCREHVADAVSKGRHRAHRRQTARQKGGQFI